MRRSNSLLAVVAAAVVLVSAGTGRAAPYHNAEYHFGLELPADWEELSADKLKLVNERLHELFPGMEVTMVAGFRPSKGDLSRTSTLLVQIDKRVTDKTSFDEFQRELLHDHAAAERGEPEAVLRQIRRFVYAKPEFDQPRSRYTVRGPLSGSTGRSYGASTGYLGPDGLVILHAFTRNGGSQSELAPLIKMTDSFQFDEPEKPAPTLLDRLFGDQVGPNGRMAIVGGVVALLVVVIGAVALRDKPRPGWSNGRPY